MLKSICVAAALVVVTAASPTFAADKMMECSEASMTKMKTDMMAMKDGEHKTMAMNEMKMADDMMAKKDMEGCMTHMNNAMMEMKK